MMLHERALFNRASHKSLLVLHRAAVAPHHNKPVRKLLFVTGLVTLCNHTPRRHRVSAAGSLACAAAHRMVHRVLRPRATQWTNAAMTTATRLAQHHVFMVSVAHLPNRRVAILVDLANLARRQPHL